jgi:predicted RND superfamily exporter protein
MSTFIQRFHKAILVLALVLTALSIVAALRLKLNVSLFSLLPSNRPAVQRFFEISDAVGFQSLLISVIEVQQPLDQDILTEFIETLAEQYQGLPQIAKVDFQQDSQRLLKLFDTLLTHLPLLLTSENLVKLSTKLSDEVIHQTIATNRQLLMTPLGSAAKELIKIDPLGVSELLFTSSNLPFRRGHGSLEDGFYQTADQQTFFIFVTPEQPPQNMDFSKRLMTQIDIVENQVHDLISSQYNFPRSHIQIHHTGGYPIAVKDEAITRLDIKVTLITSFVCVLFIFFLAFRTPGILLLVSLPLLASLIWTVGFAGLMIQDISILTGLFACVLIGLGIDFAIHMVNRFFDPQMIHQTSHTSLTYTFKEAGMGILVGGITTAMAFFAVGFSDFKGFRELGLLTGVGILFGLVAMLLVLPSMLVWVSSRGWFHQKIKLAGFGLRPLINIISKNPKSVLVASVLVVAALGSISYNIEFDDNLKNFRPRDSQVLQLQDKVSSWLGGSTGTVLLTIQGTSQEAVMNKEAEIVRALAELKQEGEIAKIVSMSQLVPPPNRQEKNIAWIKAHPNKFTPSRIRLRFERSMIEKGFRFSQQAEAYIDQLTQGLNQTSVLLPTQLHASAIGPIVKRFGFQKDNQYTAIIYLHPRTDLWLLKDTGRFKNRLIQTLSGAGLDPSDYDLTGANMLTGELKNMILQNLKISLSLAVSSILVILLLYFRNIKYLFFSIMPLTAGMSILVGIMTIFGIDFNFLNIMVVPMIIGIGIDDGVHFANTLRYPEYHRTFNGLTQTGRAVVLTSLTTIAGFGSIILSHYPGLQSMGAVAVIGIAACLVSSVIIMPAISFIKEGNHDQGPHQTNRTR